MFMMEFLHVIYETAATREEKATFGHADISAGLSADAC